MAQRQMFITKFNPHESFYQILSISHICDEGRPKIMIGLLRSENIFKNVTKLEYFAIP